MPVIPVGFSQVNYQFTGDAAPTGAEVTFGIDNIANLTATQVEGFAYDAWNARLKGRTSSKLTLANVRVKNGPTDTGPFVVVGHGTVGTSVSGEAPPQVAFLINKTTALGGRKNRGRWFYPGVAEADVTPSGTVDPATITAWNTALGLFLSDLAGDGIPMVILHNDALDPPTDVTTMTLGGTVATWKPRLRR